MRQFTLIIYNKCDVPAVFSEALANMGSLQAPREKWASLLAAMGYDLWFEYHKDAPAMNVREAAEAIVRGAVPEEGGDHPRRARIDENQCDPTGVVFTTPGGVEVIVGGISTKSDKVSLTVDFGRESTHLAILVLADMFRRVPVAVQLLAQVACEASYKYGIAQVA